MMGPNALLCAMHAQLRNDLPLLLLLARRITKTETHESTETIKPVTQEEREPWTIPKSIFATRAKECDARAYVDSDAVGQGARGNGQGGMGRSKGDATDSLYCATLPTANTRCIHTSVAYSILPATLPFPLSPLVKATWLIPSQ